MVFAASCHLSGCIYLHGGVSEARSTKPVSGLYRYDVGANVWELIDMSGPTLSHHAAVALDDRHIAFIGWCFMNHNVLCVII